MTVKHTPAAPLPPGVVAMFSDSVFRKAEQAEVELPMDDWREIKKRWKAYPRLVVALQEMVEFRDVPATDKAFALLRELGEL